MIKKKTNPKKSIYKGVYFRKNRKHRPWSSSIYINCMCYYIGSYKTELEAGIAYYERCKSEGFTEKTFEEFQLDKNKVSLVSKLI